MKDGKKPGAPERLAERIKSALAKPPSKAGMRLMPERELGDRLGAGFTCAHRALELLTEEGVLSKRQGSGNYLRKIPKLKEPPLDGELEPEDVFAETELEEEERPRLESLPEGRSLRVQLWSGFHMPGSENRSLYEAVKRHVEGSGHKLEVHSLFDSRGRPASPEAMAKELESSKADGCIVSAPLGESFLDACEISFGERPESLVFVSLWGGDPDLEPVVRIDGHETIQRALRRFASQGIRRIAMLGMKRSFQKGPCFDELSYEFGMRLLGLDYRNVRTCELDTEAAREAALSLLEGKEPPEALFVSDDHLVEGAELALKEKGLRLGRDIAGIAISNKDGSRKIEHSWTSVEHNREALGEIAAESLLRSLLNAGAEINSLSLLGSWRERSSHLRA